MRWILFGGFRDHGKCSEKLIFHCTSFKNCLSFFFFCYTLINYDVLFRHIKSSKEKLKFLTNCEYLPFLYIQSLRFAFRFVLSEAHGCCCRGLPRFCSTNKKSNWFTRCKYSVCFDTFKKHNNISEDGVALHYVHQNQPISKGITFLMSECVQKISSAG